VIADVPNLRSMEILKAIPLTSNNELLCVIIIILIRNRFLAEIVHL